MGQLEISVSAITELMPELLQLGRQFGVIDRAQVSGSFDNLVILLRPPFAVTALGQIHDDSVRV